MPLLNITLSMCQKRILLFSLLFCLGFHSCMNHKEPFERKVIAYTDTGNIYLAEVDSIAHNDIFEIRAQALNDLLFERLLLKEALARKMSVDSLLEIEVVKKTKIPKENEFTMFKIANAEKQWSDAEIDIILHSIFEGERRLIFRDSLFESYKVRMNISPKSAQFLNTDSILTFNINGSANAVEVILVMDFDCGHCLEHYKKVYSLSEKYTKDMNFKLVYLTGYYDLPGLALMAAKFQNVEKKFIERMIDSSHLIQEVPFYIRIAEELSLDTVQFQADLHNRMNLKELMETRDYFMGKNIQATPIYIVNKQLFTHPKTADYLEAIINQNMLTE